MKKGNFLTIKPEQINDNTFKIIGGDWMLITAGNENSFNTMTASWGGLGILWHKKASFSFVRPTRYTYEFMEKDDLFTLTFFGGKHKDALNILGSKSGRDGDKISETGLTPVSVEPGAVTFQEAELVLLCKKLYFQDLDPKHFLDPELDSHYPEKDYHRMYVGEVISVFKKMDN
ncbi:MAG: flavin reductase [Candidatus Aminicenantes bacterium]|nr:flavin reductase [Candidatus Aminicenantes bacterium]